MIPHPGICIDLSHSGLRDDWRGVLNQPVFSSFLKEKSSSEDKIFEIRGLKQKISYKSYTFFTL